MSETAHQSWLLVSACLCEASRSCPCSRSTWAARWRAWSASACCARCAAASWSSSSANLVCNVLQQGRLHLMHSVHAAHAARQPEQRHPLASHQHPLQKAKAVDPPFWALRPRHSTLASASKPRTLARRARKSPCLTWPSRHRLGRCPAAPPCAAAPTPPSPPAAPPAATA